MTKNTTPTNWAARIAGAVTIACVAALPALAWAQEHATHGEHGGHGTPSIDGKALALQLFNFGVLLFILIKFGGSAINKSLRSRHDKMKADLDEAQRLRAEAETRLKTQEARLANLQQELTDLRQSMKDSAEAEKRRLIEVAEARAQRIEEETRFLLDQQVKQAEQNFKAEVANAAARIAEEIVRRSVNTSDQQRLVSSFVTDIAAPAQRNA
ncbi:MAG: ATP synthase F0 subunit B [Deltaproteobacteria bacterium]|nr:ATP synthase F0 subunit B [Deltaproteobacteria bacterium]